MSTNERTNGQSDVGGLICFIIAFYVKFVACLSCYCHVILTLLFSLLCYCLNKCICKV